MFVCLFVCFGFVLFLNKTILICYLILFTFSSSFLFLFVCLKSLLSFDEMSGYRIGSLKTCFLIFSRIVTYPLFLPEVYIFFFVELKQKPLFALYFCPRVLTAVIVQLAVSLSV